MRTGGRERNWRREQSRHARVLEGLEAAIAQHPAGGRTTTAVRPLRPKVLSFVTLVPPDVDGVVVQLHRDDDGPAAA